jgi:hypothetical protein
LQHRLVDDFDLDAVPALKIDYFQALTQRQSFLWAQTSPSIAFVSSTSLSSCRRSSVSETFDTGGSGTFDTGGALPSSSLSSDPLSELELL